MKIKFDTAHVILSFWYVQLIFILNRVFEEDTPLSCDFHFGGT